MLGLLPSVLWAQNTPKDTTKTKIKEIDEVIITGFQKIEKSKITSSVDVVKMKDIEQKAVASIDQMLQRESTRFARYASIRNARADCTYQT